jgi:hypothetical protein
MALTPSAPGSALPFTLVPTLTGTTLLHALLPLAYGSGAGAGLGNGAPLLNDTHRTHYFTGRADNFDATQSSADPLDARFDPESIRVGNDGNEVFISDEYGPYVYRFNRKTGLRTGVYTMPAGFAVAHPSAVSDDEKSGNTSGRVANKGMEGLASSPNGKFLFGAMQSPLIQDGGKEGGYTRIVKINLQTGATQQYAYPLTNIGTESKPKYPTDSDMVAINGHELLLDERDGKGLGDDSVAIYKRLYHIDIDGARDVSKKTGESELAPLAVAKTQFLDIVQALNAHGIASSEIPSKIAGLAFGPDVMVGGVKKHTLFFANDNAFLGTITDSLHPDGVPNPNLFFVFAIDPADLPTYAAQRIKPL